MSLSSLYAQLLADYGSPLYVYDAAVLRAAVARITRAVPYARTRFFYASVVNGNLALLRLYREGGWGLHANTPGDLFLGLHAGFAPREIVFSGGNLMRDEMAEMIRHGVAVMNLDSLPQLETLFAILPDENSTPRLGFRLNLPEITGENRTGVGVAELREAVAMAARAGRKISGLHFYRGTGTNDTTAFTESIAAVLEAGRSLPDWEYLDFGGGFGFPYRAGESGFNWEWFGAELSRQVQALDRPIELFIEPGRACIAGAGVLLATVVSVKWQGEKQIVGTDSTVANIAVLSVHGGYREINAPGSGDAEQELFVTDVCGNTTFSRDYLGRGCRLPRLRPGDALVIRDTGAYGYAMSSHFLHRPRPAEVLLDNGAPRLIRRRESYDVLLEHQVLPSMAVK
ncbi:MAG: diaminopimelate decarboxylase family protein [Blastocatellia bacterium]